MKLHIVLMNFLQDSNPVGRKHTFYVKDVAVPTAADIFKE